MKIRAERASATLRQSKPNQRANRTYKAIKAISSLLLNNTLVPRATENC